MGLLGRQTVIAKCPACQAATKVTVYPDRASIRCPRCKATVPLTFARKYTSGKPDPEIENQKPDPDVSAFGYGSELPVSTNPRPSSSSKNRQKRRSSTGSSEISYPDHSAGFVRYSIGLIAIFVVLAIFGISYLIWLDSVHSKYQQYVSNMKRSLELHKTAILQTRKLLDPLEGAEARKSFADAKGEIGFLAVHRKKMAVPTDDTDEALKTLVTEHAQAEKELAQAEDDLKKLQTQVQAQNDPKQPEVVSPLLGRSATRGPVRPAIQDPPAETRLSVDENTVLISIPGMTKAQWTDEFTKRFGLLADNGQGQVTVKWSGDLLTLIVRPVLDPARYATKINFGRLLYYSRNDRTITLEFKPERVNNYAAQGDLITPILIDLKQRDKTPKIFSALSQLGNMKVDPTRQAEVAAVLETVAVDSKLDTTMRESAIKLIPTWSGKESAELLIRLLEDKSSSVRISAIDALVESKSPLAAPALIKKWDKFDADRITRALIILGQDIEPIVLPYLNNTTNMNIRVEACRVLQQVGTTESLKPLLDLINAKDQSPTLATAAKEAMKQILDRNK